ncbi:MAG: FtsK/SpoIIIE domain-containing protein, partial [Actinomycetota bacterium]|nr:FtsK/SpoIIIE domain-containing protein [Actinomycetota bacterium]
IAGTTGAGKSELLRTLIVGLTIGRGPDELTFVLVDFKGGGGLDAVSGLPHCVSTVSDLDDHLASRALRSLRAEVRSRVRLFRDHGVADIADLRSAGQLLPSLVVVVDDFATLAAELPDFLDSLVDIAQRGRSLGLHLVLATQRPSGVVDAKIRANTNLRVCLRVQDERDSLDVIDVPAASALPRELCGRALIRRGAGDLVEFQTAYVSGVTPPEPVVEVGALGLPGPQSGADLSLVGEIRGGELRGGEVPEGEPTATDVEQYVQAAQQAWRDRRTPAPPWLPPLALDVDLVEVRDVTAGAEAADGGLRPTPSSVAVGVCDDPDQQRRVPSWWDPCGESLLLYGAREDRAPGVVASVLAAAERNGPDDLHLYVVAGHDSLLAALAGLPHCGGIVEPFDIETFERLTLLLERRLHSGGDVPTLLLAMDDLASVLDALAEAGRADVAARLTALVHGAHAGRLVVSTGANDVRSLPLRLTQSFALKLSLPLGDPGSLASLGLAHVDLELAATRGIDLR